MLILFAEDDPLILLTLESYFAREGYEVITATNGREALKRFETHNPDVIVLDVMMPFYSGLEIVSRIKNTVGKQPLVIVLSAFSQENAVKEAFELGADDYVTKPFSLVELSLRLKRLLKTRNRTYAFQINEQAN